jgi:hypothetical protein
MALIPTRFLDSVVAIGREIGAGQFDWYGTGFLFGELTRLDPQTKMYDMTLWLVTCRHVFSDEPDMHLRLNLKNGEVRDLKILANNDGKQQWTSHPTDSVDVAVLGLNVAQFSAAGVDDAYIFSENCWVMQKMLEKGISEGDGVFVLGYPLGIMSRGRQRAIARAGIIARIRDAYDHAPNDFLIDAHIFEGNSGGPVVTRPEFAHIQGTQSNNFCMVVGIVTHVHGYNARARVLVEGADGKFKLDESFQVRLKDPAGLAKVEPIDRILETISAHRARLGPDARVLK